MPRDPQEAAAHLAEGTVGARLFLDLAPAMRRQVELVARVRAWCDENDVNFDDVVAWVRTHPQSLDNAFGYLRSGWRPPAATSAP